jgi:general stress protein 26
MTAVSDLWDHAASFDTCMLVTQNNLSLRARPMAPLIDRENGLIRFITDRRDYKDEEIQAHPEVCLAYGDPDSKTFISITGTARIETRPEEERKHWDDSADAWFEHGANDANAILIEVSPQMAEFWLAPGAIAETIDFIRTSVSGGKPDAGEHRKVRM